MLEIRIRSISDSMLCVKLHNNMDRCPEVHTLIIAKTKWDFFLKLLQTCRNHAEATNERVPAVKQVRRLASLVDYSTSSIQHDPGLLRLKLSLDLVREPLRITYE